MQDTERCRLIIPTNSAIRSTVKGLSVWFSIICIIDVFGVFPIVTLPKSIIDCGLYGVLIIIIVCTIQMYTAKLLGKCWIIAESVDSTIHKKNRYPYSALAELTYGNGLSKLVTFLLDLTVFGGGIPNLIVASQNLQLMGLRISNNSFDISFCYWIILLGTILCPLLWLGSPKDMKLLCSISAIIVATVFLLVCGCLMFGNSAEIAENNQNPLPLWHKLFTAYGIIAFQFDIHPTILTIQMDMDEKQKLPKAIVGGFGVTLCMFGVTSTIAAIKYGNSIHSSILETLPTSMALHFAAVLVAVQLCLTSAVSNSALYQHMEDCLSISRKFSRKRCILRTILTLLAVVIAESVPKFDLVMSLIGGTLTGPLVFILPPLFYIKMLSLQKQHEQQLAMKSFTNIVYNTEFCGNLSKYREKKFQEEFQWNQSRFQIIRKKNIELCFCFLIIILSCCATAVITFLNISNAINYVNFTQPCIYNVSSALLYL